ncbi:MAG: hypothetical protein WEB60_08615 [Terrimicrobiaceae bacterium]
MKDDFDHNDPLWELLGKATASPASPFFSRDVIRAIRNQESPRESLFATFFRWAIPAGAVAALALVLSVSLEVKDEMTTNPLAATDFYETVTFSEVAGLEDLVASSAGWTWDDVAP